MKEIVTFFLSGKEYGVEVDKMQCIENYVDMTQAAEMPECLQGIVMIREEVIPVLNIKKQLVLPTVPVTEDTKYLIFLTSHGKLACVADGISKILKADEDNVQQFPPIMQTKETRYADFVVKDETHLVIVINPENLLRREDWENVDKATDNFMSEGKEEND